VQELSFGLLDRASPYLDLGPFNDGSRIKCQPVHLAVFRRDFHSCRYCGFQSEKYQICAGAASEDPDALRTVCIFCDQVLHVDVIPKQRSGCLVWLPELSQAELNRAMPEIYALRISRGPKADQARAILNRIMKRREEARENFGSDDPLELIRRLQDCGEDRGEIDRLAVRGLRVMPLDRRITREADLEFNQFPQILVYWRSKNGPLSRTKTEMSKRVDKLESSLTSA